MALVRRHWKTMVLCLSVLVVSAAWILFFSTNLQSTVRAQVTTSTEEEKSTADTIAARESLDEQTYCAVRNLRQQLMLQNEDLAALGCTGASSRSVLEELLGWYQTNSEKLFQARKTRLAAKRAYRQAMRRVNMGPKDEAVLANLPKLLSAVGETSKQERELIESVIPVIEKKMESDQCVAWTSIRKQRHMPGLYRYVPNLSTKQKQSVQKAARVAAYRRMTARTEEQRKVAQEAASAEANVLSSSQRSALAEVKTKMQQKMPEIIEASQNALPAPEQPVLAVPELVPDQNELMEKMLQEQQAK